MTTSDAIAWATLVAVLATGAATMILAWKTTNMASSTERMARGSVDAIDLQREELKAVKEQLKLTGDEVAASQDQADATRQALSVSVQPLLTSVPLQVYLSGDQLYNVTFMDGLTEQLHDLGDILVPKRPDWGAFCSVPLRNVGSGVAFLRSNSISDGGGRYSWNGKFSNAVVPVGELTRLTFAVPPDRSELTELRNGLINGQPPPQVEVGYTDLSGRLFRTKLFLHWTGADWYVRQVYLYRSDEQEPFATTGPSDL